MGKLAPLLAKLKLLRHFPHVSCANFEQNSSDGAFARPFVRLCYGILQHCTGWIIAIRCSAVYTGHSTAQAAVCAERHCTTDHRRATQRSYLAGIARTPLAIHSRARLFQTASRLSSHRLTRRRQDRLVLSGGRCDLGVTRPSIRCRCVHLSVSIY